MLTRRSSSGLILSTVQLCLVAVDRHYGSEMRLSRPVIMYAYLAPPSRRISALWSTWVLLVHRAFTDCVRSEEYDDQLMLSLRRLSCMPSSHRVLIVAIPCWPGRQEPSLTGYNVCWMPQPVSSVILGSSTEAWHICSTPGCTGSMFRSESSISSEWQCTGVSRAGLPGTPWTAATPHRTLPV